LFSPGELRVYDSQGRVTGLVNGIVKDEIPGSVYSSGTVIILDPSDSYRYEVVGTEEGEYGLKIAYVQENSSTTFTATAIPTASTAVHDYTVDWNALSQGQKGVTVMVDSNGDKICESVLTSGPDLNSTQFSAGNAHPTDINGDGRVDIQDVTMVAIAFGSKLGEEKWNASVDLYMDLRINIVDLTRVARDFGKTF
jgi:hypothetical protein